MFVIPALVLSVNSFAISVADGFIVPTEYRTFGRYQLAIGADAEYALLRKQAEAAAAIRKSRSLRILQIIVREIDAPIKDKDGKDVRAKSSMSDKEVGRCREWFRNYQELVFTYTGGALRVEPSELILTKPVRKLDEMGNNAYWMSGANAIEGNEKSVRENYYDSITFYYKKPEEMKAGLLGGAIGRDYGIRGSAFWTQWITNWDEQPSVFSGPGVVSMHEWLHNISYYSHRIMGYLAVPDCHAAEEYGYWDMDGGYKQWQAWNRDLTLRYIPREFWHKLDTRGEDSGKDAPPANAGVRPGKFYSCADVWNDWQALLPTIDEGYLRRFSGISDLSIEALQASANSGTAVVMKTAAKVSSKYEAGDALKAAVQLDNILSLARRGKPSRLDDPYGGYASAPLEGIAILRIPNARKGERDLLLIRPDIAPYVLPILTTQKPADRCVLGYLHLQDPGEKQQVNVIVALVDFGEQLPKDELAAIGR